MRRVVNMRSVGLAALVAMAALLASSAMASAATPTLPSSDPFYAYTGATPLGDIAPGAVLKDRAIQLVDNGVTLPYPAQQVLYRTTGELGQPTVTVATIIKPLVPAVSTKLISYQTFYDALGSECDPSYTLQGGNPSYSDAQIDTTLMQNYLAAGFTVVNSDYEGEALDWVAGQESGYNTLDGIRAAENELGVSRSTPVGMVGYSGGSIATDWASELAGAYAPDLHIVGAAEGGVPVDLAHNLTYINGDTDGWAGVIPAVLVSTAHAFDVNLPPYLSPYGTKVTQQIAGQCINQFAGNYNGLTIQQLLQPQYQNFLGDATFASIVNELTMGTGGKPTSPMLIGVGNADGTGDNVMVAADDEALAYKFCHEGVSVDFSEYQGADHEEAIASFEPSALSFLESRFNGVPATGNCSSIGPGNSLALLPINAAGGSSGGAGGGSGSGSSTGGLSCPVPSGRLNGDTLGLVRLGMTRKQARQAYRYSANRGQRYEDFFCLSPVGVRVGYASPRLLRAIQRRHRHTYRGRVVWASTSDIYFTVRGVRPGTRVASARRHLRLSRPFHVGRNTWYVAPNGASTAVLKVRRGMIEEIGIGDRQLTRSRARDRVFLRSFS